MTNWLAGMDITADRLNDGVDATTTSSGATAATDFTVTSFSGRRSGKLVTITIRCNYTGTSIPESVAGNGNILDTAMATLPSGWRPPELMEAIWDSGFNDGGATIDTDGTITLRTTSGSDGVGNNHNPRVSATWIADD
ncbi:hypothetical protein [Streptomyces apocyni]|uniref:hypothetical protein n=1 Tax=Streptomyces apocyni TaxID=2654677 RepID=UPI0012E9F3A2|nr:hypothetical protein [Streptomyces apocyni]